MADGLQKGPTAIWNALASTRVSGNFAIQC